ncbi:MAG: selenide, water dikinase SelD [Cyanobacteria bacterium J06607_10]
MQTAATITHDLVLVGGGHSHALVLRKMGMTPWPSNVRLTLITNLADTPYSGMLPCHISGLYDFDTAHIDLRPLTRFANCRLVMDTMTGLDTKTQQIFCRNHPPIYYDTLSIDIGSTPTKSQVPGANEYAIPAKPVSNLLQAWNSYLDTLVSALKENPKMPAVISIVGGGVGGVEMAFAMQVRLRQVMKSHGANGRQQVSVHIFQRSDRLAKGRNRRTQRMVERMLKARNVQVHTGESVCEVTPEAVRCESGLVVTCDRTFWVTNAAAPSWLAQSNLTLTPDGFISVADTLQAMSHPNIFAAGDVATMVNHRRPKAGVFAVRQGPPLHENLKRQVVGLPLKTFKPQSRYLNIIDTDTEKSIASWGPFAIHAKWCRAWKHRIDQKFMALFSDFPDMKSRPEATPAPSSRYDVPPEMHCTGCGSKVGNHTLTRALTRVRDEASSDAHWPHRDNVYTGLDAPDDAAIIQIPPGMLAVHTVDQFSALVDDPYVFGQICVNHCLSDLFAMGATPHNALALTTIPYGNEKIQEETLYQLLSGAMYALGSAKTFLVGGHTTEGSDLSLGFACNGWIDPAETWKKSGLLPGQSLILTKALGTGTLFAADQQKQAKGRWIEAAIASMLLSNQSAFTCLKRHGATACTDVTGFGLAGHLIEMLSASQVGADIDLSALVDDHNGLSGILPGAAHTLENGLVSSLHQRNLNGALSSIQLGRTPAHLPQFQVLFDPQTSGGLLASVPKENTVACLKSLRSAGYVHSRCIGAVTEPSQSANTLTKPLTLVRW